MRLSDKSFAKCPVDINRLSYAYDKMTRDKTTRYSSSPVQKYCIQQWQCTKHLVLYLYWYSVIPLLLERGICYTPVHIRHNNMMDLTNTATHGNDEDTGYCTNRSYRENVLRKRKCFGVSSADGTSTTWRLLTHEDPKQWKGDADKQRREETGFKIHDDTSCNRLESTWRLPPGDVSLRRSKRFSYHCSSDSARFIPTQCSSRYDTRTSDRPSEFRRGATFVLIQYCLNQHPWRQRPVCIGIIAALYEYCRRVSAQAILLYHLGERMQLMRRAWSERWQRPHWYRTPLPHHH